MKKPVSVFTDNLSNVSTAAYDVSSNAYPTCLPGRTFFVHNYEVLDVRKLFSCISMCACVYECYGYKTLCSNLTALFIFNAGYHDRVLLLSAQSQHGW